MTASPHTLLDTAAAIQQRRSMKSFTSEAIAPEILQRLVELTVAAPSSYNLQDWRIVLVQGEDQKQALAEAAFGQQQVLQAPVTFVFAADSSSWKDETIMGQIYAQGLESGAWSPQVVDYFKGVIPQFMEQLGPKTREYAIKDAMIAATHTALAAQAMGLSSCFMNGWQEEAVKRVIGAVDQPNIAIAVLLAVGYGAQERQHPGRLPLSTNVFVDRLGQPYDH